MPTETATVTAPTDRFDIPKPMRDFLDEAIRSRVLDGAEVFVLACKYGGDFKAIREIVMGYAFNNRHHAAGREAHANLSKLNDAAFVDDVRNLRIRV